MVEMLHKRMAVFCRHDERKGMKSKSRRRENVVIEGSHVEEGHLGLGAGTGMEMMTEQ